MKLRPDYRAVLTNLNFLRLWTAQVISAMGAQLTQIALFALVTAGVAESEASWQFSKVVFWAALPGAVLGPVAGVFIDRWNRRRIMIGVNLMRAPLVLSLWIVFSRLGGGGWLLFALLACTGMLSTFFNATESAVIPTVVGRENILAANSLAGTVVIISTLVGTAVAGAMVTLFKSSPQVNFIIDALGFLLSAALIYRIILPPQGGVEVQRQNPVFVSLLRGLSFIRTRPKVRARVFLSVLFWFVGGAFYVLALPFATKVLRLNTFQGTLLLSALGLGLLMGGLVIGMARTIARYDHLPYFVLAMVSVSLLAFSQAQNFSGAICAMVGIGFLGACFNVPIEARLQELVPNPKRGRVFGARGALTSIFYVLSLPLGGKLAETFGIRGAVIALSWGLLALTLAMIFFVFEVRYHLYRLGFKIILKIFFRLKVEGLEHVPLDEPIIFAPNHVSYLDGIVLAAAAPIRIRFLVAKEEYNKNCFRRWIFRRLGFIPIDREARSTSESLGAIVLALRQDKENVVIYPEGCLSPDGMLGEFREGIALVARKARVPIVPVATEGLYEVLPLGQKFPRLHRIRVRFGLPIRSAPGLDRHELTARLRSAIVALMPSRQGGHVG